MNVARDGEAILPQPDSLTEPYWQGTQRGELLLQHCAACGDTWHPPMPRCPTCHSADVAWKAMSGKGTIYSFTDVEHAVAANWTPYRIVLVDLDEGPRLVAGVRGEAATDPGIIGRRVCAVFQTIAPDVTLPMFELA